MTVTRVEIAASDGSARTGVVHTARGAYPIPAFMPVGTRGTVKALDAADLESLDADVVLVNAFHLMMRPGAEKVAALGGLHRFMGWTGHTLSDSGGYQVHSLRPSVDDEGVTFASIYDGARVRVTPESAVEAQGLIGSDIQMVLDVCATLPASADVLRTAVDRTAEWAERARRHHRRLEAKPEGQALFGIVQGGTDPVLRKESARRTVDLEFDGYAVGGLSVGEPRDAMIETLAATVPHLPPETPRYLMGVGDPVGLVEAVALGVDQFDCVAPTRMARHGTVLTAGGRLNLRNAVYAADDRPLDPSCPCATCSRYSRGYLRHLITVGEPTASRLVTLHNLAYLLALMGEIRAAIAENRLDELRRRTTEVWSR
jgi:queuine tRNA-ribosyltransferase